MATLTVGGDKQFTTVSAAVAASHDGDTVQVDAGTYTNDFAHIGTSITLTAVGGMVHLLATASPPDGKAIFTTDGNITINGFEFSGAAVPDQNGAGIRMQTGDLTLNNCYFHDNENGILTTGNPDSDLVIDNCEFDHNGNGSGFTHGIYVGGINSVTITDSYFHNAVVGHEIKSRAASTTITNNRIQDEAGSASYSIDLSNGGNALIRGNVIEQGPNTQNPAIISYGPEGLIWSVNSLTVDDNVILNDDHSGSDSAVRNFTSIVPTFTTNDVFGLTVAQLPASQTGTTFLTVEPPLDTSHPFSVGGVVLPPPPVEPPPPPPVGITLNGGNDMDLLIAGDGNYTLNGLGDTDILIGGPGNDLLNGGPGTDYIVTGTGLDSILFDSPLSEAGVDKIFDFSSLDDKILLGSSVFTAAGALGSLAPEAFFVGNAAHDADDRIIYDSVTSALYYDPDGTGAATATQFATVYNGALTDTNFKIV